MKYTFGVLNTDQLNRQNLYIPVGALANGIATHIRGCVRRNMPLGMPSHISHDIHRFTGWCQTRDIHLTGNISRQLGAIEIPETEEEWAHFEGLRSDYWKHHHDELTAPYREELVQRVLPVETSTASFIFVEAATIRLNGLASTIYPELFLTNSDLVDKDGLVDYRLLLEKHTEVQPGVFHDPKRDVLLFAHRFFRRSLSHSNTLNMYFLSEFSDFAKASIETNVRIRLDPDIIGHPNSVRRPIELEYWRGPHFQDDIEKIPDGVAEHKADKDLQLFEGVDKTQLWWKHPETRNTESINQIIRTFEVEELIENPSGGLADDSYGCRYSHAEYDVNSRTISHFDGAIRAYDSETYLDRIDASIDRAGKRSEYTKLFRLDLKIPVSNWKQMLSSFFRGNGLIPEYLNQSEASTNETSDKVLNIALKQSELAALVRISPPVISNNLALIADNEFLIVDKTVSFVELGAGKVAECLSGYVDISSIPTFAISDKKLNLSPLVLGRAETVDSDWKEVLGAIADAIEKDVKQGILERISLAIIWNADGLSFAASIAGEAARVAQVLAEAANSIRPSAPITTWIGKLSEIIRHNNVDDTEPSDWSTNYSDGRLRLPRTGEVNFSMKLPDQILSRIEPDDFSREIDTSH